MPPISPPFTVAFGNAGPPLLSGNTANASAILRVVIRKSLLSAPLETSDSNTRKSSRTPLA